MTDARLVSIAAFLKRHLPAVRGTPRGPLLDWLGWYWTDARVGVVRAGGRIVAVGLARCLHDEAEKAELFRHVESGRLIWVEHIVSLHPQGLRALLNLIVHRFGPREALAGDVFNRDGELRKLPWKTVVRLIDGENVHEHKSTGATCSA